MNILIILVPLALLLGFTFLLYFLWASRSGQFDDLETPALKIFDDEDDKRRNV